MYTKSIPFKDFNGKPRNQQVHFNLTEDQVFELMVELKSIFDWRDTLKGPERELPTEEVIAFYRNFKEVILAAYGKPSEDGLHFRKGDRYDFEESALFSACIVLFITDPSECIKLLDAIMPPGMEDIVQKQDANLEKMGRESKDEDLKAEVDRLRAQLAESTSGS